jgi:hypothetical protein
VHLQVLMRELPMRLLRKPEQWPAYHPYLHKQGKPLSNPKVREAPSA